jgi:hypothetical protein
LEVGAEAPQLAPLVGSKPRDGDHRDT